MPGSKDTRPDSGSSGTGSTSRKSWEDGLDAPGRPESHASQMENRDLALEDEDDISPAAMEGEVYIDGEVHVPGTEKPKSMQNKEPSGFAKFKRGLRSFWVASPPKDCTDKSTLLTYKVVELILYLIFLTMMLVITFGMSSSSMYFYSKVMGELFLDGQFPDTKNSFRGMTTMQDIWRFMDDGGPMLDGLYWEKHYNGKEKNISDTGFIFHENRLLGVPRLRQLKVRNDSCTIHDDFADEIRQCYDAYSEAIEDKNPIARPDITTLTNETAWVYQTEKELGGQGNHQGLVAKYGGGGYVQTLGLTKNKSASIIAELKKNLWVDRGTRAVMVDFTVYNANINLFCVMKLVMEFPATGGVIPSWSIRTIKLIRYVTPADFVVLACEGIFVLFILYYIVEEALEISKHKMSYLKDIWNWLDMLVILVSIICVVFSLYRTMAVSNMLELIVSTSAEGEETFADFEFLSYWQVQFNYGSAVAVFFAWFKIFKYISFNKTMTQLTTTLGKARKDLLGFGVMFLIIFFAFAQLGYLLFGTQVKDFSNFGGAGLTLFRIILGDFDFHELEAAHRVLGPLFFMLYVFFVFFVLLNMFLAIINDTYAEVKAELANQQNEFEMADFFKQQYNSLMVKLNLKRDKIVGIQKALRNADSNNDKQIDMEEFRKELKMQGFSDGEIEAAFTQYDVNGDRILDEDEQRRMRDDLEMQRLNLTREAHELEGRTGDPPKTATYSSGEDSEDETSGRTRSTNRRGPRVINGVAHEEFTVLSRRVDRMEHSIGSIVSKIDAVLVKLEAMEKAKTKRRENMGKLLSSIDEDRAELKKEQLNRLVEEELEKWGDSDSDQPNSGEGQGSEGSDRSRRNRSRPHSSSNESPA